MQIVVDSDLWGASTLFADLGDVVRLPGREITSADLRSADALIVRSVTQVDESLLAGSAVRFVGTATSGTDHVDHEYLRQRRIAFASAEGCNARPVVEYVVSCLFEWRRRTQRKLGDSTFGVIGCGRIGRAVVDWGTALGMRVLAVDPPLAKAGMRGLCTLEQVVAESDIVTLHVPLTNEGPDTTRGIIDARRLDRMKPGAWLINAARGPVVGVEDLIAALNAHQLGGAILDVWSGEPDVSEELLRAASLMTPHIAGYSAGAHRRAAQMIAAQISNWAKGREPGANESDGPNVIELKCSTDASIVAEADLQIMENLVQNACNIAGIDSEYRQALKNKSPVDAFDRIRAACRSRKELTEIEISGEPLSNPARVVLQSWSTAFNQRPGLE